MSSAGPPAAETALKLIFLGDAGVGKTCMVQHFVGSRSESPASTVGVAFVTKSLRIGEVQVNFQVWDTAGQERFRSLAQMYYKNVSAAVVVYDITSAESFKNAQSWARELRARNDRKAVVALAGNKCDRADVRMVLWEEANRYATAHDMIHLETSATSGHNVAELFHAVAEHLPHLVLQNLRHKEAAIQCQTELIASQRELDRANAEGGGPDTLRLEAHVRTLVQQRDATGCGWEVDGKSEVELEVMLKRTRDQISATRERGSIGAHELPSLHVPSRDERKKRFMMGVVDPAHGERKSGCC